MRKIREVLRLCFDHQLGQREIARSAVVSQSTVHEYLARFAASGLTWPLPAGMSETSLEARLYPPKLPKAPVAPAPPPPATETQPEPTGAAAVAVAARCPTSPDWQQVDQEMQSHKYMTPQLVTGLNESIHELLSPHLLTAGGAAVPVAVTITRIGGFSDAITVSASGLPANVSASPITIAAGATTGTLSLTAASTAAAVSNANVTVTGTGAGVVSQSQNLVTSVQVPSFSLSVSPASVSLNAGGSSVAVTATITRSGGFAGSVSLALTGLPAGVTPNSATIAAGSTSAVINLVAAAGSAAASNVTVTATGSGSGVTNQTKTFQVSVIPPSFTMSLTPSSVSLVPGGASVGLQVSITRLGTFSGAVSLTLSGLSSGVSPSTASIAAGATSTTINMVAASGAPQVTNQTVTVTGSGSGVSNQSGTFLLTVQPITVSVGPSGVSRQPGQTQQFTATATGNTAVTWSLTGIGALSSATSNTVIYTAPLNITYTQYPQIKATSVADPTKSATVGVTLNPPNPPSVGFVGLGLYTASTATYTIQATANPGRIQEITYYASDMSYSTNKCQLRYDQAANRLYIGGWIYDWEGNPTGIGWTSSGIVGSAGTISGLSCWVDLAQSSAAITGDTLTLNLRISLPAGSTRMDIGATDYSGFNAWVSGGYTNVTP